LFIHFAYAPNPISWIDPLGLVKLRHDKSTNSWNTPSGLSYGQGSAQGNRIKHVLEHESPNATKNKHSVFCVCKKGGSLDTVDEAWKKRWAPTKSGPNDVYDIDMGRSIGNNGERIVRIVTKSGINQVITAYPIN